VARLLAPSPRRAQLVDREPGGHGREEGPRRCDLLAGLQRPMHPQQRFLHHVLGLGNSARQPIAIAKETGRRSSNRRSRSVIRQEPLPPARVRWPPPQFELCLGIGGTAKLGHYHGADLPDEQPPDEPWNAQRLLALSS
jgi:hypothetical protein